MLLEILRRLAHMVPTVVAVVLIIFVLFSVLPGSVASGMFDDGRGMDPQVIERMKIELGLDKPVHERFIDYIGNLAVGDLGRSFKYREKVTKVIGERLWPSLKLTLAALAFAIVIGIPIGFYAALRPGGIGDFTSMVIAVSGLSLPKFWLGLMLAYQFALVWKLLPSFGYGDGDLKFLILPAVALGVSPMALLARTTRAAVLEVMNADFVRTARSKGMSEVRVVEWHVLRNVLVLVLTTIGLQFGSLLAQAVVVEQVFSWPGLGSLLISSINDRDIPAVQGCILVIVLFFLAINTLVDLAYVLIDPRIRLR
jgi:peptide/nickel transport system permease protein